MRIEEFLARHKIKTNPFSNAEEAQGDEILMRLLEKKNFQFGHPQWPKFYGEPPGNQTSIVFGLKGSGKTAMRLALNRALHAHNEKNKTARALLVNYDEFNNYIDIWRRDMVGTLKKSRGYFARKKTVEPSFKENWSLANHMDAIMCETTRQFEEMLKNSVSKPQRWSEHTKYELLMLAAIYLPYHSHDYKETMNNLDKLLFSKFSRFVNSLTYTLASVCTLGIYNAYRWWTANQLAKRIISHVQVLDRDIQDLRWALSHIPMTYLQHQPLTVKNEDPDNEAPRFTLLEKLIRICNASGYERLVVVIDKVDEPSFIKGDYNLMADFIVPLWNNKLLQTNGIDFKMLLPAQLHRIIRKADSDLLNTARLDKANMIHPFTWSGKHLYEMLSERTQVCHETPDKNDFTLRQIFADDVSVDEIILQLERTKIPRYASKFLNRALVDACDTILTEDLKEGELPKIPRNVFLQAATDLERDIKNDAQDLQEI